MIADPNIYEHAHLAYFATLGWRIDKADFIAPHAIEFQHQNYDGAPDGNNHLAGTANSWQEAIDAILEIEGIEA